MQLSPPLIPFRASRNFEFYYNSSFSKWAVELIHPNRVQVSSDDYVDLGTDYQWVLRSGSREFEDADGVLRSLDLVATYRIHEGVRESRIHEGVREGFSTVPFAEQGWVDWIPKDWNQEIKKT